jgi:hypothetical protein
VRVDRLQQTLLRDEGQVVVPENDGREAALLMPERVVERLLLGPHATAGLHEVAPQVHLPRHERHHRDRPLALSLDQLGDLLRLAAEELPVAHRERQPEHQLVEEHHHGLVAEALSVPGDRGESLVERHEFAESAIGAGMVLA